MNCGSISQKSGVTLYAGQDWQLVERWTPGATATSYTFSGLTGDTETEYRIIAYVKAYVDGGFATNYRPNNDSTAGNYGWQWIKGSNTTVSAASSAVGEDCILNSPYVTAASNIGFADIIISAKTGTIRPVITKSVDGINGTTINAVVLIGQVWTDTANEITSIKIYCSGNIMDVGTDVFLFARRLSGSTATSGQRFGTVNCKGTMSTGMFQLKERYEVTGSAVTSKTFSGLNGNTCPIYILKSRVITGASNYVYLYINNDSSGIYGRQSLYGQNTTIGANRSAGITGIIDGYTYTIGDIGGAGDILYQAETLIYAKTGNARVAINTNTAGINGTSVFENFTSGVVYNETSTNMTSLVVNHLSANGIAVGSVFELYQLNLGV